MPYYLNKNIDGLIIAQSLGDGYTIQLRFSTAYPSGRSNKILYNIYMNQDITPAFTSDFFNVPPTFIYTNDDGYNIAVIPELTPGDMYHFGVRAAEYNPTDFDPTTLPLALGNLRVYPQSLLASNISATDTVIPLIDAYSFPDGYGTVRIGIEQVFYTSIIGNSLIVPGGTGGSGARIQLQDGYQYLAGSSNIGVGVINNLTVVNNNAPTETWFVKCVFVQLDGYGNPIPNTSVFVATGSVSGGHPNGQDYQWVSNNIVVSNTLLSFSIEQTGASFVPGDYFVVKVQGAIAGVGGGRGYNGTIARPHNVDGYDGYETWNPEVIYWPIEQEEDNTRVFQCWNRFDIGHWPYTLTDGYRQTTEDILTTNLTYSDEVNTGFPEYDFAGWHRTDPVLLLNGTCVGSYIGGYMFCADGYSSVGVQLRGLNIQQQNMQRQEVLLSTTGEPVNFIQRVWTGITCKCMLPYNEYPENRCKICFGTGIVVGYLPWYDDRYSDGRLVVRFSPSVDDLLATDSGLESSMSPDCWTLPTPTLKDRDFIVRYDEDGNEEFRYEILNVTRNKLLLNQTGVQKFAVQRIRKTDPIYQVRVFGNTAMYPFTIQTDPTASAGLPLHTHSVRLSETIQSITDINQLSGVSQGHNHPIYNGVVLPVLGHSHTLSTFSPEPIPPI